MRTVFDRLQRRLVPALLAALGVSLMAAGLLTYTAPVDADPGAVGGRRPTPARARRRARC